MSDVIDFASAAAERADDKVLRGPPRYTLTLQVWPLADGQVLRSVDIDDAAAASWDVVVDDLRRAALMIEDEEADRPGPPGRADVVDETLPDTELRVTLDRRGIVTVSSDHQTHVLNMPATALRRMAQILDRAAEEEERSGWAAEEHCSG